MGLVAAYHWSVAGHRNANQALDVRVPDDERCLGHRIGLLPLPGELSAGSLDALETLCSTRVPTRIKVLQVSAGWAAVARMEQVARFLQDCVRQPVLVPRVLAACRTAALLVRLRGQEILDSCLDTWYRTVPQAPTASAVAGATFEAAEALSRIAAFRTIAGHRDPLPPCIQEVLDRPARMREEAAHLERLVSEGTAPDAALPRLRNLRKCLDDEAGMASRQRKELSRLLARQERFARLDALDALLSEPVRAWLVECVGQETFAADEDDRENAIDVLLTTRHNRRLMKKLLRHLAAGEADWPLRHPGNVAFLERARASGIDVEAWTGPFQWSYERAGRHWELHVERDPLRILQMGNHFGTCLAAGGINVHAAIANAVEVNKRVLILRDERGTVRGRKLLAMDPAGNVCGYHDYGADESEGDPWLPIALNLAALAFIRRSGARPYQVPEFMAFDVENKISKSQELFAEWYDDWARPYPDWMLEVEGAAEPDPRAVLAWVRSQAPGGSAPARVSRHILLALLWLGNQAIPLLELATVRNALRMNKGVPWTMLIRHTDSEALRRAAEAARAPA